MNITVVIPLYNKGYTVENCLLSVLMQTKKANEIIIINDGSTDCSLSTLNQCFFNEIKQGIIKIISKKNEGVSIARNTGVELSSNEYICFLDADDQWKPNFLEKMKELIIDFPNADMYSLAHLVNSEEKGVFKPKHGLPDGYRGYVENFFKASSKGSVVNSSKVCVRKESLMNIGGFPRGVTAGEDLYTWIRLALNGKVACDIRYLSVINRFKDDSRGARKMSVPYPLIYFSKNKYHLDNQGLRSYLSIIFLKHFIASIKRLDFKEAFCRLYYYLRIYL